MEQSAVVEHVIAALERLRIPYAVVGSFASMAYGETRLTRDIDILVELAENQIHALCEGLPPPDWYVSEAAARDAVRRRGQFNAIHTSSGNKVDFILPRGDEWSQTQLARRLQVGLTSRCVGFAASPEDVILGKLLYFQEGGSEKHLRDIGGMLLLPDANIDRAMIAHWAARLGLTSEWEQVLRRISLASGQ